MGLSDHQVLEAVRPASGRAASVVHLDLKRRVDTLATITVIAPMVGFFETVLWIISSFRGLGTEKSTVLHAYRDDFMTALPFTALGLLIGITAFWFHRYLTMRVEAFDTEMQNGSLELVDQLALLLRRTH